MPRRNRPSSARLALGGVFGALALAVMLLGSVLPAATIAAPAFAGILIVFVAIEWGMKTGYLLYGAIGILSLMVVPDKEMALLFVFFLGYYPLAKARIERLRRRGAQWAVKIALFNGAVLLAYGLILFVFPLPEVREEFAAMGWAFAAALLALGNVTFALYDVAVARTVGLYCARLRPQLLRKR